SARSQLHHPIQPRRRRCPRHPATVPALPRPIPAPQRLPPSPNAEDAARLLEMNKARGFPGMLGSIDCMHWSWKNCPKASHGQFHGQKKGSTIILEAVADQETWIWHAFFGMPGSLNDINVINRSPLMNKIANGDLPPVQFVANGRTYNYGYYLTDGI
uniref:DDE Tnp4 domain-containing protein n=1 Tax=Aegilops tauschii subsp. strangulata TaxID=200361 RepID=A0A452XJS6_AEGTS